MATNTTIECVLKRPGGTKVTLNGSTYEFVANKEGRFVCDVTNETDAKRLLTIPEAYRLYNPKAAPAPRMTAQQKAELTERNTLIAEFKEKFSRDPDADLSTDAIRAAIESGTGA